MIGKIVMLSIAIVIASFVIGGAIVAAQVIATHSEFVSAYGQNTSSTKQKIQVPKGGVAILGEEVSNSYDPSPLKAKVGQKITWVNQNQVPHTVTSDQGLFGSGIIKSGQTFNYTFDKAGEYTYHCEIHPEMHGTVIVSGTEPSR